LSCGLHRKNEQRSGNEQFHADERSLPIIRRAFNETGQPSYPLQTRTKGEMFMKNRKVMIIGTLAVLLLAGVPFIYAQHQGMHGGMHGMHGGGGPFADLGLAHLARAKEYLGLSDAQVDQLKTIGKELHEQNAPYRQQLHGGLMQVAQTLISDPNNVAAAKAQLEQQNAVEATLKANTLAAAAKALNVLTPDQRAKVGEFLTKRAAMHNDR
jgi:periplasmic protein CpxP/Spy